MAFVQPQVVYEEIDVSPDTTVQSVIISFVGVTTGYSAQDTVNTNAILGFNLGGFPDDTYNWSAQAYSGTAGSGSPVGSPVTGSLSIPPVPTAKVRVPKKVTFAISY
jgi:hypothetical protein